MFTRRRRVYALTTIKDNLCCPLLLYVISRYSILDKNVTVMIGFARSQFDMFYLLSILYINIYNSRLLGIRNFSTISP